MNRRYMRFEETAGVVLPDAADPSHTYLLYLHIPFCEVLCPFCPFHRVEFQADRTQRYFRRLRDEIRRVTASGYRFGELYVGGGTPTVLPEELAETIELVRSLHPVAQVSVETNPDDLADERLGMLRQAGVNRLSVGVQSFDDTLLREMQRYDKFGSGAIIRERIAAVSNVFDTLNVDMIFNFPHQDSGSVERDLQILTEQLSVDQVSWYPLMTARSTDRSMEKSLGKVNLSPEHGFYRQIAGAMTVAGYRRSSAWCFSRAAGMIDEYITGHEQYVGLGSGAFSYIDGTLYASTFSINHYLRVAGGMSPMRCRRMGQRDQMRYYLLMFLFSGALDIEQAETRFAGRFARGLWPELTLLRLLRAVRRRGNRFELTERGYYLWVMMMREFFIGVNNFRDEMRHSIRNELRPQQEP
ncbi:MAG: coproporphyrinogen III oxidase family protein [Woeseia sp.]|nr:coproporphyrinogen III oxidase family protein [Woeseia sp.]